MQTCEKCQTRDGDIYYFHQRTGLEYKKNKKIHTYAGSLTPVSLCIPCIRATLLKSIFLNLLYSGLSISIGLAIVNAMKGAGGGGDKWTKMIGLVGFLLILGGIMYLVENIWLALSYAKPSENTGDHASGVHRTKKWKISFINDNYKTRLQFQKLKGGSQATRY